MTQLQKWFGRGLLTIALAVVLGIGASSLPGLEMGTAQAQSGGSVPGNVLGSASDAEMWRAIRKGVEGTVSIPDKKAGVLVQSEGDNWRAFRNGPLSIWGGWALAGVLVLVCAFFALRGRIRIDAGPSGITIERFNAVERFAHWLTASSFIVLALTGLNVMYGRYVIKPIIGADAFAGMTEFGKLAHNYIGFAFMLGILMMLVLWVRDNIPNKHDLKWLAAGGGLFSKHSHPPAKKFNAGQKIIFWGVILLGGSASATGVALLFPFEINMFAGTFAILNIFGFDLPTTLSPLAETQLAQLWHAIVTLGMMVLIIGHIYIGSIGMEGAFDAVGTGHVDLNWAKEHHALWVEEHQQKGDLKVDNPQPAE